MRPGWNDLKVRAASVVKTRHANHTQPRQRTPVAIPRERHAIGVLRRVDLVQDVPPGRTGSRADPDHPRRCRMPFAIGLRSLLSFCGSSEARLVVAGAHADVELGAELAR